MMTKSQHVMLHKEQRQHPAQAGALLMRLDAYTTGISNIGLLSLTDLK